MKKIIYTILSLAIISQLYAQESKKEYTIMVEAYKITSHDSILVKKLARKGIKTTIKKDKKRGINYVIIKNIKTKTKAKQLLKTIKKFSKDAYIITKKIKPAKVKTSKVKTIVQPIEKKEQITTIKKQPKQKTKITPPAPKEIGILLHDAVYLALSKSKKISEKREKIIQAKRKIDQKVAAYFPVVTLSASAEKTYLHPLGGPDVTFSKSDETITINQNIYAGGKHSNDIKKEQQNLKSAIAKFKDQVEEECIKIIDSYLSLIYQKEGIKITRENMLTLKKILDIVQTKEESGAATKGDLNYIKSQVENASAALVKEESKYQNAIAFYEYYVGKLTNQNTPIEHDFKIKLQDQNITLEIMKKNNAKIQVAQAKLKSQKFNLQSQKSKFKPTIDLTLMGKDKQSSYEAEPHEDRAKALLSLNYNLFNGGKDKAILLETKSKIQELQYKFYDTLESSLYNTKQMYENILSSQDSIIHTQKEVEANKKVIDSYWLAFKYGTQDIQALLLAQRALNRSELDVIKEKQKYINSYFKLIQQTGELLEYLKLEDFINPDKIRQKGR